LLNGRLAQWYCSSLENCRPQGLPSSNPGPSALVPLLLAIMTRIRQFYSFLDFQIF
jgi:hypothetical protein